MTKSSLKRTPRRLPRLVSQVKISPEERRTVRTAQGETTLNVYAGKVILDGQEFDIPVVASRIIEEYLLGVPWLRTRRLVADLPAGLLTLGQE